ncbi:MAG TPA: hypothetical protein VLG17_13280, partial [Pseudomonas sp.]|uniref:Ig-like domain-containing protein n=1 Tax=Pseudomonas sp. TaxID=306 RepID=UPI002B50A7B9
MKGLRELALSCLLFGCAASAAATEIAGHLLKLDPLVYFGAESFQLDEVKGLNSGQAGVSLSFSSNSPTTVPSFLGNHAGRALKLSGQESFELQADFLSEANLAEGIVLGFFAAPGLEPGAATQCLLSVGSNFALTLVEHSFKVYEQGENGRIVEWPDLLGPDEDQSAMFLVFSTNKVEVYKGFDKVWDFTVAGGTASLAGSQVVLGDCSAEVKEALIQEGIGGYEGWLDELTVVPGDSWREFSPLELSQSTMLMPFIARGATRPQMSSWQAANTSIPRGPKAVEKMNDSFCPVDEGDPVVDEPIPDTSMVRTLLMMAGMGAYPLQAERRSNGSYSLLGGAISSFAGFVYPATTQELPIERDAKLFIEGQDESGSLYHSAVGGQVEIFHKGEGFFMLAPLEGAERIEVDCYGDSEHCQNLYTRLDQGIAFGMPKSVEPVAFGLERDGLPNAYDRSLRSLSFTFSDALTAVDVPPQQLPDGLVKLYVADAGEQWAEQPIESSKASGNTLELAFNPRLKSGRYRVVFDTALNSYAGVALGEAQNYEFTVTSAELLVNSNTSIGQQDFQHDGKRLIVDGATLTLSGEHDYEAVVVRNSGIITSPANQRVTITADEIEVDASSRIDVSSKGSVGTAAVGAYAGGSYGGSGGAHSGSVSNA